MASLYPSTFLYMRVQPHQMFRHKSTHTWCVSEIQVLFWSALGVILLKCSPSKLWLFPWRAGHRRDRQHFMSILYGSPDSSVSGGNGTFRIQQAELLLTSACLLEMNTCNQKQIGSLSSEDFALKDVFICFLRCASIWAQQLQRCSSSPLLSITGNSEYLMTLL